jgi:hypothetical protein
VTVVKMSQNLINFLQQKNREISVNLNIHGSNYVRSAIRTAKKERSNYLLDKTYEKDKFRMIIL